MADVPFPIPYQGSKRKLAPVILGVFPSTFGVLYEPFCGSAAVSIAAVHSGARLASVSLNDTNTPLANLWQRIIEDPVGVADAYERLWEKQIGNERDFYDQTRDEFNRTHEPTLLLYLLARCVKAAVRYNAAGEFNQSPDNRRLGTRPTRMRDHLTRAARLLSGRTTVTHLDYREALASAVPADVVYMDPPYQGVSTNRDRRYKDILSYENFVDSLDALNSRGISFIVSYDGKTGEKQHGRALPHELGLTHLELDAGRSTQATFLGQDARTIESLYISPSLVTRLGGADAIEVGPSSHQVALL